MQTLEERIDEAFKRYRDTLTLVDELIASQRHPQEIILLTCARLDSLANLAFAGKPPKDAFVSFLGQHSGATATFEQISIPDLYNFLAYQLWVLPGTVEKPGRLHMFDPQQDERYITFLWESDLPITVEALGALIKFILAALKRQYRVSPTQALRRSSLDTRTRLSAHLESKAATHRKGLYRKAATAIRPLISEFSVGVLLYKRYRCGIIHEYGVDVDERNFFKQESIYWRTIYKLYVPPLKFLQVEFPARLLSQVFVNSIEGYEVQLKKTQKLPSALFNDLCHFPSELHYLDERSIPEGRAVRIAVRGSGSTMAEHL
jgi:hypothetical protein